MKINEVLKTIKEYVLVALGIMIYVTGWTVFLVPNNLVGGGVTGVSSILQYATGGAIRMGYTYFAINLILLIIALFTLGKAFGIKTVFAIILASVGLNVLQDIIPADICYNLAVKNGKLMSTIIGGITAGIGGMLLQISVQSIYYIAS